MTDKALAENDLEKLAARVENATWPDRDLDALIWCRCGLFDEADFARWDADVDQRLTHRRDWYAKARAPAYTASLDAAMLLVPDGVQRSGEVRFGEREGKRHSFARVSFVLETNGFAHRAEAYGATDALALTAASLRARASLHKGAK